MRLLTSATLPVIALLAASCTGPAKVLPGNRDTAGVAFDEDGDGFAAGEDCNDEDSTAFPGALERCDGVDNNCDGVADEGVQVTVYPDADSDGFGDGTRGEEACGPGDGFVSNGNDCDDTTAAAWPGNPEACDGLDNDCNGAVDDGVGGTVWADADMDGFGDAAAPEFACTAGPGTADNPDDCDDADPFVSPDGVELCNEVDDDCDGETDEGLRSRYYRDVDGDTYGDDAGAIDACERPDGTATRGGDCDDTDFSFFPGAPETDCTDPADYNCDGTVGYADADADGYPACVECDDASADVSPAAAEVCNRGIDDDCDGLADDADPSVDLSTAAWYYEDADADGFGDASAPLLACDAPAGFVADDTDCDDATATRFPGAPEVCNSGIDDDCDGLADDADPGRVAASTSAWYRDADGDGYGTAGSFVFACAPPAGYVALSTDCDDTRGAVSPGATEVCDGLDNDCDALTDDADTSLDLGSATTWYRDNDGDAYGDPSSTTRACLQPTGFRPGAGDCDDTRATVSPAAREVCNSGLDDDCDGAADDADTSLDTSTAGLYYTDGDRDGYGAASVRACVQPSGTALTGTDCDDTRATVSPAAAEVCDSLDNDCDTLIDDADPSRTGGSTWYRDADGDGWGVASPSTTACTRPSGYAAALTDCNDGTAAISPSATEVCDLADNDCDGSADEGYDADGDGIVDCREVNYTITIEATGDDVWSGWIDGASMGTYAGWNVVDTFTYTLNSGTHTFAAYAADTGAAIAGFLAVVKVNGVVTYRTANFKVSDPAPSGAWTSPTYNDSAWATPSACSGSQVSSFWGSQPSSLLSTGATWMWHTNCQGLGDSYWRLTFTLP